ncbi:MAG TPA: thiamine phosphate synthase, partial [Atribacteraceae bacterium]|nr:thiamine phosphate synthase [Atribacteraceae bacterium]
RVLLEEARIIREITQQYDVGFIVNDRIDIALAARADGVHLGDTDLPLLEARRIAPHLIIGSSCATVEEARAAEKLGADYLGVGSVYPTATKPDAGPSIGLDRLREIKCSVRIPVVAIGGINLRRAEEVLATGVNGLAVVSVVIGHPSPRTQAAAFRNIIVNIRGKSDG